MKIVFLVLLTVISAVATAAQPVALFQRHRAQGDGVPTVDATFWNVNPTLATQLTAAPSGTRFQIPLDVPSVGSVTLSVERYRVFTAETEVYAITANGPERRPTPQQLLLRGTLVQNPKARVVLAVYEDRVLGMITIPGSHGTYVRYLLQPFANDGSTICFDERQAAHPKPWSCAEEEATATSGRAPTPASVIEQRMKDKGERTQNAVRRLRIALEGDNEYYRDHGQNLNKAVTYAEAVLGASSDIYERDAAIEILAARIDVWTVADPYPGTTSGTLLTQFRDRWRNVNAGVERATAMLLSGVNNIGGVAYVETLCSKQWGYAVSGLNNNITYPAAGYVWDTDVFSHEFGHNVGSPHTHNCAWSPPIDSCVAPDGGACYTGTRPRLGTIMSYCHLTAFGTSLEFHPRVSALLTAEAAAASCSELVNPLVVVARPDTTVCHGANVTLSATISGGLPPYTIVWNGPALANANSNPTAAVVTQTTPFILVVTDATGTIRRDTVVVTTSAQPLAVSIPWSGRVCPGTVARLASAVTGGTPPYTYTWAIDGAEAPSLPQGIANVTIPATTAIELTITDARNCVANTMLVIETFPKPRLAVTLPAVACPNDTVAAVAVTSGGAAPFEYEWFVNGADMDEAGATLRWMLTDDATVRCIVTDRNRCIDTMTVSVRRRMLDVAMTPPALQLPNLSGCRDTATVTLRIQNYVTDTVRIVGLRSTRLRATTGTADTGLAAPIVLPPGDLTTVRVRIRVPFDGPVNDTLRFVDARCGRVYAVPITGMKGSLVASPQAVVDLGTIASCSVGATTTAMLGLRNTGAEAIDVTALEVFGVDTINAPLPVTIAAGASVNIPMYLSGITAGSGSLGNIRLQYTSPSCNGRAEIPTTSTVFSYQIEHPDTVFFGTSNVGTAAVVRPASVVAGVERVQRNIVVTRVDVVGPFSTTLRAGTALRSGRPETFAITFHPDRVVGQGDVVGRLSFDVDTCAAPYSITLRANHDATTSVPTALDGTIDVVHDASAGVVTITSPSEATIVVSDILGRTVQQAAMPAGTYQHILDHSRPAVLVVTVITSTSSSQRILLHH
jgi:hypothetical protein